MRPYYCTALGGDHNNKIVGSGSTEFVFVCPRNHITDVAYLCFRQGGGGGRVRKSASAILTSQCTNSDQLGPSLRRHNVTVQMTDANFLTSPAPPPPLS